MCCLMPLMVVELVLPLTVVVVVEEHHHSSFHTISSRLPANGTGSSARLLRACETLQTETRVQQHLLFMLAICCWSALLISQIALILISRTLGFVLLVGSDVCCLIGNNGRRTCIYIYTHETIGLSLPVRL